MKLKIKKITYKDNIKDKIALVIAVFGILLLWPLMVVIAIIIKVDDKGSVLFCQERLGKDLKIFRIYKFRTMKYNPNPNKMQEISVETDERITRIGRILRKTSLDEIPQLFNILNGDMCIIGPRPILEEEFKPFSNSPIALKRFQVKPGLFCKVDMKYRALATRTKQFELDEEYVNNISFPLDFTIFIRVLLTVLSRKNVYSNPIKEDQIMHDVKSPDEKGDSKS